MSDARSARFNPWRFGVVVATAITIGTWAVLVALDKRAAQRTPPEPEMVEVCVAAKDLPVGTLITPETIARLVTRARVPKDSATEEVIVDESQLHDKRITQPWRKGEMFKLRDVISVDVFRAPKGAAMYSVSIPYPNDYWKSGRGNVWSPEVNSWVQLSATVNRGDKMEHITLARDLLVFNVGSNNVACVVSVVVAPPTIELMELAHARGCELSLAAFDPVHPFDSQPVDATRVRKFLESLPEKPASRP